MAKNNITTQGYFVRRLRNSGFITSRVYDRYSDEDQRKWTIVVNPTSDSVLITCCDNGEWPYKGLYELSDGGRKIPRGYYINTDSIEVIISHLITFNIDATEINNLNGRPKQGQPKKDFKKALSEETPSKKDSEVQTTGK